MIFLTPQHISDYFSDLSFFVYITIFQSAEIVILVPKSDIPYEGLACTNCFSSRSFFSGSQNRDFRFKIVIFHGKNMKRERLVCTN